MTKLFPSSLRGRFLLVLAGALLPLALVGWWLTESGARAAERLLKSQLEASASSLAQQADRGWTNIRGELLLLAENEVASRTLSGGRATRADTAYMRDLLASVRRFVPSAEYVGRDGRRRWEFRERDSIGQAFPSQIALRDRSRLFPVSIPVRGLRGDTVGSVVASLDLDRSLGLAQRNVGVFDASLAVFDRVRNVELLGAALPPLPADSTRFSHDDATWLMTRRSLPRAQLELVVLAPTTSYVGPFRAAARAGLVALGVVFAIVALASVVVTRRLTTSLADLADTASAVAAGDLERTAAGGGGAEVDRVAGAFNAMSARLRVTIAELSHRQSLAAVGQFASALSHEVRNALTAVRVDLQRAQERMPPGHDATPIVNRALEHTVRLDSAVTSALRVARAARMERVPVDVRSVIDQALVTAEPALAARSLRVTVQNDVSSAVVGDAIALQQLMLNLILNAAQASDSAAEIRVQGVESDGHVTIRVQDDGCGVAPEHVERIMDPFFSTKVDGTGLGLSISRQIAMTHGGSLDLVSDRDCGTTATVRLPVAVGRTLARA